MYRSIDEWFYGMVPVRAAVCKACKLELACLERGALGKSPSSPGPVELGVQGMQVHHKSLEEIGVKPFPSKEYRPSIIACAPKFSKLPMALQLIADTKAMSVNSYLIYKMTTGWLIMYFYFSLFFPHS